MAGELDAGIEGNWSDKDIVIAYVYLLKRPLGLQQYTFCSRLVGPTASGKSSVGLPISFVFRLSF